MKRTRTRKGKATWMRLNNPDAIRRRRKRMGYTQRDLAALVGCSHAMIGYLERGEIKTCTITLAEKICRRLDMDLEEHFAAEGMPTVLIVQANNNRVAA
jgi:transcriptional regulator with XRE-family HTH domain